MEIKSQELQEYSAKHAELKWKGYRLSADLEPFLFLYVGPRVYTLAWDGSINFSELDYAALYELPNRIFSEKLLLLRSNKFLSRVLLRNWAYFRWIKLSLITSDGVLTKYALKNPVERVEFELKLRKPEQVCFARYDVVTRRSSSYSLIAENRAAKPMKGERQTKGYSELAIKLPRSHLFTKESLLWIVRHHENPPDFDLKRCVGLIRELTLSG